MNHYKCSATLVDWYVKNLTQGVNSLPTDINKKVVRKSCLNKDTCLKYNTYRKSEKKRFLKMTRKNKFWIFFLIMLLTDHISGDSYSFTRRVSISEDPTRLLLPWLTEVRGTQGRKTTITEDPESRYDKEHYRSHYPLRCRPKF